MPEQIPYHYVLTFQTETGATATSEGIATAAPNASRQAVFKELRRQTDAHYGLTGQTTTVLFFSLEPDQL